MNQQQNPQPQQSPRLPRRRLIQGRSRVRPSPPAEMAKAYNDTYRRRLVSDGIPDRRLMAEAIMQATLEDAMIPVPPEGMEDPSKTKRDSAKHIMRQASELLKALVDAEDRPIYTNAGIRKRMSKVADGMAPVVRRTRTATPTT